MKRSVTLIILSTVFLSIFLVFPLNVSALKPNASDASSQTLLTELTLPDSSRILLLVVQIEPEDVTSQEDVPSVVADIEAFDTDIDLADYSYLYYQEVAPGGEILSVHTYNTRDEVWLNYSLDEDELALKSEAQSTDDPDVESSWEKAFYVDDFNDPTDEWYIRGIFSGTFSNSATTGSELEVITFIDQDNGDTWDSISFRLFEYGSSIASLSLYEESDIVIKLKINDDIYEDNPNWILDGDIYLLRSNDLYSVIIDALKDNQEISCVIETSFNDSVRSKYRFTLDGQGFSSLY